MVNYKFGWIPTAIYSSRPISQLVGCGIVLSFDPSNPQQAGRENASPAHHHRRNPVPNRHVLADMEWRIRQHLTWIIRLFIRAGSCSFSSRLNYLTEAYMIFASLAMAANAFFDLDSYALIEGHLGQGYTIFAVQL
ncbi:uncharacterized protein V1513DRAFT_427488 [Lipomyces chichibuensis]|uniref:uncharacterized protein n=1 Tax=Lipomyces chichibuensis TaxID=1546026 RepID=UPI00334371EF